MTKRHDDERGAAAVEFAMVMPILLLLVFGIISYGVFFAQDLALSNSARQAARYGVIDERTCADVVGEARDYADTVAMDGDSIDMTVDVLVGQNEDTAASVCSATTPDVLPCEDSEIGDNVYVNMRFRHHALVPLIPVPDYAKGKGVFRCEFS